jgi:hypothetical protein
MNYLFIRYYYSMLIIKNYNSGKDLNDFWLESKITNCCNVVKHKQSSNKIKAININELYNEYYDTYTNQSEKLKKTNNVFISDNNNNNYVKKSKLNKLNKLKYRNY